MRRAERRGKELPTILKTALEQQIERCGKYGTLLPWNTTTREGVYPSCGRTLTARGDGSPCIDRGQEVIVEKCGAFLPLAGDKAGSVAYTENGCPTLRAESPTACVVGIDFYNGATTGKVSKTITSAATDSDHIPCVICYNARGNGDGKTVPTITGDHNNRLTDYTAVVCETYAGNSSGNDIAGTLDASYYKGVGTRNGKEREFVVIAVDRSAFNQGENAKYNIGIDENGTAFTVTAKGPGAVCYCLQGNGVDRADTAGCNGKGVKENECYTLNTVDRYAVCYGFSPDNSPSCDGVNLNEELSPTLQVHKKLGICREAVETQYIVRRLTPLECCRLQGMPDWWLDDVEGSDAARYKLWGNGMALPNALYIMEGIAQAEANE